MNSIIFQTFGLLILIPLIGLSIYCVILYIKLVTRGIKALDIYINKNIKFEDEKYNNGDINKEALGRYLEIKKQENS